MVKTAPELRALRAVHRVRAYEVAARSGIAPTILYEVLNEKRSITEDQSFRIQQAIEELAEEGSVSYQRRESNG